MSLGTGSGSPTMPSPFDQPQPDPRERVNMPAPNDLPNYRKIYRRICDLELIGSELEALLHDMTGLSTPERDASQKNPLTFDTINFSEFIANSNEVLHEHQKKLSRLISEIRKLVLG